MDLDLRLHQIAEGQHGLLTRNDLSAAGVTRHRRAGLVDRGAILPVRPKVFRVGGAPPTVRQDVLALCLDRGAVASHRTAAWLHGLSSFDTPARIEVLGPRAKTDSDVGNALVHTTTWLPHLDRVEVDHIPTLSMARTVLSLCSLVPADLSWTTVKSAVDEACRRGLATDAWLWWRLEQLRRSGRNGVTVMERILNDRREGDVTESWLESAAMGVFRDAGLPLPRCQARIAPRGAFVARVDFAYDAARLIVEVAGHHPHKSKPQAQRDAERARGLVLAGWNVLPFTYDDVVRAPARMVREIRAALALADTA